MKQLNLASQTKEEEAIEFIRGHEPPEGYVLLYSGGKDSVVLRDATIKAGVQYVGYYSNTTIDPPEIRQFVKTHAPEMIWKNPKQSFWKEILRQGIAPTQAKRWC